MLFYTFNYEAVAGVITGKKIAEEAADMVLTDDNFASIEAALEARRIVYDNRLKPVGFILSVNGEKAITILVRILAAAALPISPVQILQVNMASSVALNTTITFEPKSNSKMD